MKKKGAGARVSVAPISKHEKKVGEVMEVHIDPEDGTLEVRTSKGTYTVDVGYDPL